MLFSKKNTKSPPSPLLSFFGFYGWTNNKIIALTQNQINRRKPNLMCVHGRITILCSNHKMRLKYKKVSNQIPFYIFFQTKKQYICEELTRQKSYCLLGKNLRKTWVFINEEFKQSSKLEKRQCDLIRQNFWLRAV